MAKSIRKTSRQRASKKYRVFISHATTDQWIAKVLCEKLQSVGADTFRDDRDIKGGDVIPEEIRLELKRCNELLVLLTPTSVGRTWVHLEVGAVWSRSKKVRIVSILYHATIDSIPDIIKEHKAFHLNDLDRYLVEVAERAERYSK